jgi:ATP-dependent 26S proteasome regulatory subunit
VIGATNKPWDLIGLLSVGSKNVSWCLCRPLNKIKHVKHYASNLQVEPDVDLHELARLAEGFSGSDIRDVCQSAQLKLIGEFFESG